jgi:hypothetical protein
MAALMGGFFGALGGTVSSGQPLLGLILGAVPGLLLMLLQATKQWYSDWREKIRRWDEPGSEIDDFTIIKAARKYGGVLTRTVLSFETGYVLRESGAALERFVQEREAKKVLAGDMDVYLFPSAQVHMLDVDKKIIELILTLGGQASRTQLLRTGGLSLEAL